MTHKIPLNWKRTFFPVWVGQAFSLLGSELVQFSLIWYLTEKTGSASVLAIASFMALLPRVFLSPISGALVDRWNRQKVMIYADALVATATIILAGIFWLEYIQVWHIYVIFAYGSKRSTGKDLWNESDTTRSNEHCGSFASCFNVGNIPNI